MYVANIKFCTIHSKNVAYYYIYGGDHVMKLTNGVQIKDVHLSFRTLQGRFNPGAALVCCS